MEIKYVKGRAFSFVFYEANTFYKLDNGDLQLVFSTYKCVE